jgi:hypothetical protein
VAHFAENGEGKVQQQERTGGDKGLIKPSPSTEYKKWDNNGCAPIAAKAQPANPTQAATAAVPTLSPTGKGKNKDETPGGTIE